jgi:YggT family protein
MVLDAVGAVQTFIYTFASVYTLALILYVLTSWIQLPYSLRGVQRFLAEACDPYLRFWRRLLPLSFGAIDFSPIVAILALGVIARILVAILNRF